MEDYQGRLRLTLQGLDQIRKLDDTLQSIESRAEGVRRAITKIGDELEKSSSKTREAFRGLQDARNERLSAQQSIENTAQRRSRRGRFLPGPSVAARRMARDRLQAAIVDGQNARLELGQALDRRRELQQRAQRASRMAERTLPALAVRKLRAQDARQARLGGVQELASSTNQILKLGGYEAQFQRRLEAFRRGGGGTNAPELIEKVFEITQAYAAQRKIISATGDTSSRVTRKQAAELSQLSSTLVKYNEAQLEANRLARSRVERLSAARGLGDKVREFENIAGQAFDAGKRSPVSRRDVQEARQFANRAVFAAEAGDQEAFRLSSFRAKQRLKRLEQQQKLAAGIEKQKAAASVRDFNIRQNWSRISAEAQQLASGPKALPSSAMLAERVARTPGGVAPVRVDEEARNRKKREAERQKLLDGADRQASKAVATAERAIANFAKSLEAAERKTLADQLAESERVAAEKLKRWKADAKTELASADRQLKNRERQRQQLARAVQAADRQASKAAATAEKAAANFAGSLEAAEKRALADQLAESERVAAEKLKAWKRGAKAELASFDRELKNRERQRQQLAKAVRAGGPKLPVKGDKFLEGSPAYVERIAKMAPRSPWRGSRFIKGSPVAREYEERLAAREAAAQARQEAAQARQEAAQARQQAAAQARQRVEEARLRTAEARLEATRIRRDKTKIVRGAQGASPVELKAAGARRDGFFRGNLRGAIGESLIGGAFPLLFGQGAGASVGGLAGGLAGGMIGGTFGFGGALIGTAIGQIIDTTVNKLASLGDALSSASRTIAAMEEAGLKVRDSQKIQIAQLEKVGRGYQAQGLILKEMETRLGPGSAAQAQKLSRAQKELGDSWAALSMQLGVVLIPALVAATNAISDILKPTRSSRAGSLRAVEKRTPSDVMSDMEAAIALNEVNKAASREYASLVREAEDWRRDNEEKILQMRRQGADIEAQKAEIRREVEEKIFNLRQEASRLEIENARSRAQLAAESADLGLARRAEAAGGGLGDFVDRVREYLQLRAKGEAELQHKERTARQEIEAKQRDLQQYVLQVSEKVASINKAAEEFRQGQERFRFESARRLEDFRMRAEDYIFARLKERYEYAIGSESEILRIRMEAANAMGAVLPPDAHSVLGGSGSTQIGSSGLANPIGPQPSGRSPWWNDGLGAGRGHQGQDLGVDPGTTIHAIETAIVDSIIKGFGRAGDAVVLRYANSGRLGVYGHINPAVKAGQKVEAGQRIGVITRDAGNEHLHYELWDRARGRSGTLLDPTERLRAAMSGRRERPQMPATLQERRQAPALLLPGASGPRPQMFAPPTTDTMLDRRRSSIEYRRGSFSRVLLGQAGFEDVASSAPVGSRRLKPAPDGVTEESFRRLMQEAGASPYRPPASRRPSASQGKLPTYGTAPAAPPLPPPLPSLPPAPAPMAMPDIRPLLDQLKKQSQELAESGSLARKLQEVEEGRLLLQLTSTRDVRDRLERARDELAIEKELLGISRLASQEQQELAPERVKARIAAEGLAEAAEQGVRFASEMLGGSRLQKAEYDQIVKSLADRVSYEKQLLEIAEQRAEVARQDAFLRRRDEQVRGAALIGVGLRAGFIGEQARAYDREAGISGKTDQAIQMASGARKLEDERLVWENLEQNIVATSDALSGALTNGLLDVISGSRQMEEVGRDMLNSIARSFADSAQQQLSAVFQRQLVGPLGGTLAGIFGGGAQAAGPETVSGTAAAATSLWSMSSAATAAAAALQTIAAQAALSGAMGSTWDVGSIFSGALGAAAGAGVPGFGAAMPNLAAAYTSNLPTFAGFFANGGNMGSNEFGVVGEKEPEFFFPGVAGRVVPASSLQKAERLRNEEEPPKPIEISYTVTERQGERVVTEEQLRQAMSQTVLRAQAAAYRGMRNSSDVRSYVGL